VRYWAAARDAAGVELEVVQAATLAELLAAVRSGHDERLAKVLGASSLLLDGVAVGQRDPDEVALGEGATVEVLPPFAGG
jgi:molybdopterin converting factor small subunit